jgi:hypothetical protein
LMIWSKKILCENPMGREKDGFKAGENLGFIGGYPGPHAWPPKHDVHPTAGHDTSARSRVAFGRNDGRDVANYHVKTDDSRFPMTHGLR